MREVINGMNLHWGQQEYFAAMLDDLLSKTEGNIVEFGCGFGLNTVVFLKAAKKYGRKVLAIDPFETGDMPPSYRYPYHEFVQATKDFDNLELYKFPSQDPSCLEKIKEFEPIAFVFVDGLQYKDAVLSDLKLAESCNPLIICVDDMNRLSGESQVPLAIDEFKSDYKLIRQGREAYLCK